jgi:Na+-transporting NADH:ubiquinone oxidoreductase subunit B
MTLTGWLNHQTTAVTGTAPHLRSAWSSARVTIATIVALVPPLVVTVYETGTVFIPLLALSLAVVIGSQLVFSVLRHRAMTADGIVTGLTFALMLPLSAVPWQVALGLVFGVVIGEQIFGGRGRNFLNPAIVAMAFLIFSFPAPGYEQGGPQLALATLPGGFLLLAAGLISWRVVAAAAIGFVAAAYFLGVADPFSQLIVGSFAFGVVFLACDPVSAASTNPGRWVYGLIVGGLAMLGRTSGAGDGTVFAILLASVFAPLIDQAVVFANVWSRRRRHG